MKRVYVIGTFHAESGLVTVAALLAILARLQPEVIFLEAPVGTLEPYLTRTDRSLESETVNRYRETHPVTLVPVDLPTPHPQFFQDGGELHRKIERRSGDYCRLHDWDMQFTREGGFPYLNSETFADVQSLRHKVMLATLDDLADQRLKDIYQLWCDTIDLRDQEMMRNVEGFLRDNAVSVGVLLVGAAHRRSLSNKSRESAGGDQPGLHWDFSAVSDTDPGLDRIRDAVKKLDTGAS